MDHKFVPIQSYSNMRKCILFDREGVRLVDLLDVIEKQVAGLLREETLRRFDKMSTTGPELAELRSNLWNATCPV